jgi:hypothetical protein
MCNLYNITTNQEAIRALFRVMNRYVGNLPPMPGVFRLSRAGRSQCEYRTRVSHDALGHAATAAYWRSAGHKYPQHVIAYGATIWVRRRDNLDENLVSRRD